MFANKSHRTVDEVLRDSHKYAKKKLQTTSKHNLPNKSFEAHGKHIHTDTITVMFWHFISSILHTKL